MIIDAHCHMGTSWMGWKRNEIDAEKLLRIYDQFGVDKACLSAWQVSYDFEAGNREIYEIAKRHPDRIVPFAIVGPRDGKRALEEIDRCVEKYGMKGLKMHPTVNKFIADSSIVDPVMEKAKHYGLPVLFHSENDGYSHPRAIAALAAKHQEVTVIIGHMGEHAWIEAVQAAKKHKNILLDTTGVPNEVYILPTAVEECGAEKIVWGSDAPVLNIAVEMAKVKYADLYGKVTEEDKQLILGGNMARVLKLS